MRSTSCAVQDSDISGSAERRKLMVNRKHVPIALCLLAAVLVFSAGGLSPAHAVMSPQEYWKKGLAYADNRLYLDAVDSFTRAIRTNKGEISIEDVAKIFNSRGLAFQGLNEPDKAIDDFSNAISLDEKNPEFYMNRGLAQGNQRLYERAVEDFSAVIKLNPRSAPAYANRAKAFLDAGNYDRAIADYQKFLEMEPGNILAWYHLGLAYKNNQQEEKALDAFGKLLDAEPKHAGAAYQKAGIFSRLGKIDSACVWLETAVENGFRDWSTLKNDTNFDNIRRTDCYRKLMAGK
jgi:tetratricopeptide (TPR) repeat protein